MSSISIPAFFLKAPCGTVLLHTPELVLKKGSVCAVTGPSGAGKSLFLKSLFGWAAPGQQGVLSPKEGHFLMTQDPLLGLTPGLRIGEHFREVPGFNYNEKDASDQLRKLGLKAKNTLAKLPRQLSGGERQRAMLAMILVQDPSLLACDEPAASLDEENETQLWRDLSGRRDLTQIFVTHRMGLVHKYADRVIRIENGKITFDGNIEAFKEKTMERMGKRPEPTTKGSDWAQNESRGLEVKDLVVRYGDFRAVDQLSFSIRPGGWLWVTGPSGAGKTSLAKAIAGLIPFQGELRFQDKQLQAGLKLRTGLERRQIQFLFQHGTNSFNPVRHVSQQLKQAWKNEKWQTLARDLALDPLRLDKLPSAFSQGEIQRLNLIRALGCEPRMLICDELLSPLDEANKTRVMNLLLNGMHTHRLSVMAITHQTDFCKTYPLPRLDLQATGHPEEAASGRI